MKLQYNACQQVTSQGLSPGEMSYYSYLSKMPILQILETITPYKILTCSWYQLQLKAYYTSLDSENSWNLLKPWLAQKVHVQLYSIFLFCCIITTQLLSTSLKSELQFLSVSEMGIFYTLVLNFKDWPFDVMVSRHFRPKSGQLNERYNVNQ